MKRDFENCLWEFILINSQVTQTTSIPPDLITLQGRDFKKEYIFKQEENADRSMHGPVARHIQLLVSHQHGR